MDVACTWKLWHITPSSLRLYDRGKLCTHFVSEIFCFFCGFLSIKNGDYLKYLILISALKLDIFSKFWKKVF